jgi:two-component system, OmpR family, sensor kinase
MALISLLLARSIGRPVLRLAARAEAMAANLDEGQRTKDERRKSAHAPPHESSLRELRPPSFVFRLSSLLTQKNELATLTRSLDTLDTQLLAYTQRIGELEQARARFLRTVSHELRTPLTAIRGTVENVRDVVPPAQQRALATIEEEAARLSRLVDALLSQPAENPPLRRRPVDLVALVGELYSLQQGRARRAGVELQRSAEVPALVVLADRDQLKQVLLNLLDNALRYTPPGGQVRISLDADESWAELRVADSGPGVPHHLREQIWQRGVRGSDLGVAGVDGSAGLGLAIVREIVAAHGGSAALAAGRGPGAEFVIRLPMGG